MKKDLKKDYMWVHTEVRGPITKRKWDQFEFDWNTLPTGIYKIKREENGDFILAVSDTKFDSSKHIYQVPGFKLDNNAEFVSKKRAKELIDEGWNR